jgi:hypothetical protein
MLYESHPGYSAPMPGSGAKMHAALKTIPHFPSCGFCTDLLVATSFCVRSLIDTITGLKD